MGGGNLGIKSGPPLIHRLVGDVIPLRPMGSNPVTGPRCAAATLAVTAELNHGDNGDSLVKCADGDVVPSPR